MNKCSYALKYKAVYAPTCNGGVPCDMCWMKWVKAEKRRLAERLGRQLSTT